jgi:zinc D-Ala-D-Ala carboxypeptidase
MPVAMLSEHFSLAEFTYSQTASRLGLDNRPGEAELANLERTAAVMEEVRRICGDQPVQITSGYRSPAVNAACGGSSTSAHMSGLAADFIVPAFGEPIDICHAIEPYLEALAIDQLIHEYGDWVHLGLAATADAARCECLTITNAGTTTGFA